MLDIGIVIPLIWGGCAGLMLDTEGDISEMRRPDVGAPLSKPRSRLQPGNARLRFARSQYDG